jgi:anti-sigma factor RsiW
MMTMDTDELICAYIDRELDAGVAGEIEDLIARYPEARQTSEMFREISALLHAAPVARRKQRAIARPRLICTAGIYRISAAFAGEMFAGVDVGPTSTLERCSVVRAEFSCARTAAETARPFDGGAYGSAPPYRRSDIADRTSRDNSAR